MKSLKSRLRRQEAPGPATSTPAPTTTTSTHAVEWSKYDDRLMKAAERGDAEKVSSILAKKGVSASKLDLEGRSAFHVVASKGNLECLNAILLHGVDVTASDPTGRNALHLAAKYGHALCLQKLLQYNCPTEHVDLQGRTALHDAAMADCLSSIQLLCDHGASVNAKDMDGRTPLVLATQMCRPAICQLLLDRGAEINSRDKQNRTALMLGCEYGCREAVEVLVKNGADVTLLDTLGHDSAYYARIGDNLDILNLLKAASESSSKGQELWRKGPSLQQRNSIHIQEEVSTKANPRELRSVQDVEMENEDLKERLRKIHQEQRILLDKVNGLQLQLNEEVMVADDLESEREKLKSLLAAKEKQHEESLRTIEVLKSRFKYYECPSAGAPAPMQSKSMLRPLELSLPGPIPYSENEILKKELEAMRTFCESAKQDRLKLQSEVAHKAAECKALELECKRVKEDSDEQIRQLEDALKDVQKRMHESEGKVKQMQAHFLILKERLTSEAAAGSPRALEELKEQLRDMKEKYQGASAEVATLSNQIRQNEMLVDACRRDEGRLLQENRRLQDLRRCDAERTAEMEGQLKDLQARVALCVPTEKFESMKTFLSGEAGEKAKKLAEAERENERARGEIRQLTRELESVRAKLAQHVRAEDHEQLRSRLEQKAAELAKRVAELTLKNQALQKDVEQAQRDNGLLTQQVHSLTADMKTRYVPLSVTEDLKRSHAAGLEDLNHKLADVTQKYAEKKRETERLLAENTRLSKDIRHLETAFVAPEVHEKELGALKSSIAELNKQLSELRKTHGDNQERINTLLSENASLKKSLGSQYVPIKTHKEMQAALNGALEKSNRELLEAKRKLEDLGQELAKIKDEGEIARRNLENAQNQMKAEYVHLEEHTGKVDALSQRLREAQDAKAAALAEHKRGQEEVLTLHAEIEAQKKELDTIQECLRLKYAPIARLEESERKSQAAQKELQDRLAEQTLKCSLKEEEARRSQQESQELKKELAALQKEVKAKSVLVEGSRDAERALGRKTEELGAQLRELSQRYAEAETEKEKLQEALAKQTSEVQAAQSLLQRQHVPLEQFEALKKSLDGTIEGLREELRQGQRSYEKEQRTVSRLQELLENQKNASVPLADHLQVKEALEKEVGRMRASLREKEEESQHKTEEVSRLQTEVQSARQALRRLESREVVDLSKYTATKSDLETQISGLNEKLAHLNRKYEEAGQEVSHAKKQQLSAKEDKELQRISIAQEIKDQQERCDRSLATVMELQQRIQESAQQIEAKDNKITELLNDVERLKQALNGLSQLTYTSSGPGKRQGQLVDTLQHQVKALQQQLADADRQHQEVITIYRTHLLSAAQGHMDEDVQAALLQIIRMRQGLVC